jgi:CheY-like chemotaxis protein
MARILLIEDERELRSMLAILLRRTGHTVEELDGGAPIVSGRLPVDFDLVLTDIYMREGEGIETLRFLRARHPGVPVVVMSGAGFEPSFGGFLGIARQLGASGVLRKPFAAKELVTVIESLTSTRAA